MTALAEGSQFWIKASGFGEKRDPFVRHAFVVDFPGRRHRFNRCIGQESQQRELREAAE